jgi:hypothetical protein
MQVKTKLKAGMLTSNHNQTLVRDQPPRQPLKMKTKVQGRRPHGKPQPDAGA